MSKDADDKKGGADKALAERRKAIDALDQQLLKLLSERAAHAQEIGHLKQGGPVYRPEREAEVLRKVMAANAGPIPDAVVAQIYTQIMSACRALEQPLSVAYLGPQGTFSEMALEKQFGSGVQGLPCASFDEVFHAAETGAAAYAVVPAENSTEGAIGRTLDLLLTTPLKVCAEVVLRVHQNLMARDTPLDKIGRVYSHAQSLGQCQQWLSQHLPRAERISVASNAEAARLAAAEAGAAAIGPSLAASRYGLQLLAENIEDEPNNMTRFLVLGSQDAGPTGHDHTSLVMSAPNRPGAVHELLTPLATHGVSMTRIESRPSRTGQWEYYFYVDLLGHQQDANVARAIAELKSLAPFLKVFGSYPSAVH
jgi:chorismate mutase/prephenate dehydratase